MALPEQKEAQIDEVAAAAALSSPPFSWMSLITIKIMNLGIPLVTRKNGTVNRCLVSFFSLPFKARSNPKPINGVSSRDVTVDPARKLWFRLFTPAPAESSSSSQIPVIVYFHGGGFTFLSADLRQYDGLCRRLSAEIGAVVVSVNYRLAPEHRHPAQFNDGFDVLQILDDDVSSKGNSLLPGNADVTRCFLAGDSAGGNLAHHVAVRACNNSDLKSIRVIGLAALQPFFGGEERTESELKLRNVDRIVPVSLTDWYWKSFLSPEEGGDGLSRDHEAVNVSGPRAVDLSKLSFPATMVVVGGFDSIQDWQRRYYRWLKDTGKEVHLVEYPSMVHTFFLFPELKESDDLIAKFKDFVCHHFSK